VVLEDETSRKLIVSADDRMIVGVDANEIYGQREEVKGKDFLWKWACPSGYVEGSGHSFRR
jgi:hypothetical protein